MLSAICFSLDRSKILLFWKGLNKTASFQKLFVPLPNDRILDLSKSRASSDDKLKVIQMAKFVLDKIENIVGKEESAG